MTNVIRQRQRCSSRHAPQSVVQHQNIVKHSCETAQQKRETTKLKRNEDDSDARAISVWSLHAGGAGLGAKLPDPGLKPTRKGCHGAAAAQHYCVCIFILSLLH